MDDSKKIYLTPDEEHWESLLREQITELPVTEDVIHTVTPWRKAMKRVLWGFLLNTITIRFLALDSLLPAIGALWMLLGFRSLRGENPWFDRCYRLSVLRVVLSGFSCIFYSTIWHKTAVISRILQGLGAINLAAMCGILFCLWRAMRQVREKAGQTPVAGSALSLLLWYLVTAVLAILKVNSPWIGWGMVIGYIMILCSMYRMSWMLEEIGYAIVTVPVRISDRRIFLGWGGFVAVVLLIGQVFFARYPMEWTEVPAEDTWQQTREYLVEIGMPEQVARDLTEEDLELCKDAVSAFYKKDRRSFQESFGEKIASDYYYHPSAKDIILTHVMVKLDAEGTRWRVIHHFSWQGDPKFYGTEAIQILPAYDYQPDDWYAEGNVGGQILYDQNGVTYEAPYYRQEESLYYSAGFSQMSIYDSVVSLFSFPYTGENQRGYVSYGTTEGYQKEVLISQCVYVHQIEPFLYPRDTARDYRTGERLSSIAGFDHVYDAAHIWEDEMR